MKSYETNAEKKGCYYEEINLFRGFAIFSIILGHAFYCVKGGEAVDWNNSWRIIYPYIVMSYAPLGTWFFVFISGFLFYPVFYLRGFVYKEFIKKKFKHVFMPYIIFAGSYLILKLYLYPNLSLSKYDIYKTLITGSFWYVPFIMCIFLISPLFIVLLKINLRYQCLILILSIIISLGLGRSHANPILQCIYFFPAYFLGIILSINYDKFKNLSVNIKWSLLYVVIGIMTILSISGLWYERFIDNPPKFYSTPNYIIIVKLIWCSLYLYLFLWLKNKTYMIKKVLTILARYSFTLFFFQQFPMLYFLLLDHKEFVSHLNLWTFLGISFISTIIFCIITILIFAPLKRLLGKYSRSIIGC